MLINNMVLPLMQETVWFDKYKYEEAERLYEEKKSKESNVTNVRGDSFAETIANARKRIQNALKESDRTREDYEEPYTMIMKKFEKLEEENSTLKSQMQNVIGKLSVAFEKIEFLEQALGTRGASTATTESTTMAKPAGVDEDDIDLFGSDDEDEATSKLREERLKAYESKKSKKAPLVAKSSVVLDVKPWDDETDLKVMEAKVREIKSDGLVWGASKFVPLAYGIRKLQIVAVVEDEKVSIDWLQETIQEIEDLVQSVDVAAFNKL